MATILAFLFSGYCSLIFLSICPSIYSHVCPFVCLFMYNTVLYQYWSSSLYSHRLEDFPLHNEVRQKSERRDLTYHGNTSTPLAKKMFTTLLHVYDTPFKCKYWPKTSCPCTSITYTWTGLITGCSSLDTVGDRETREIWKTLWDPYFFKDHLPGAPLCETCVCKVYADLKWQLLCHQSECFIITKCLY